MPRELRPPGSWETEPGRGAELCPHAGPGHGRAEWLMVKGGPGCPGRREGLGEAQAGCRGRKGPSVPTQAAFSNGLSCVGGRAGPARCTHASPPQHWGDPSCLAGGEKCPWDLGCLNYPQPPGPHPCGEQVRAGQGLMTAPRMNGPWWGRHLPSTRALTVCQARSIFYNLVLGWGHTGSALGDHSFWGSGCPRQCWVIC